MIPDFEGWKKLSPVERTNTTVCLNPGINVFLVYNTFNIILRCTRKWNKS